MRCVTYISLLNLVGKMNCCIGPVTSGRMTSISPAKFIQGTGLVFRSQVVKFSVKFSRKTELTYRSCAVNFSTWCINQVTSIFLLNLAKECTERQRCKILGLGEALESILCFKKQFVMHAKQPTLCFAP